MNRKKALPTVSVLVLLILSAGCEGPEGPQGPVGPPGSLSVYVVGWVGDYWWNWRYPKHGLDTDSTTDGCVEVYDCPGIPSADMNGIRIPPVDPFRRRSKPFTFAGQNLPISDGDSVQLNVTYQRPDGTPAAAHASLMLPALFDITCPDTSYDTISIGDSLVFCWTPSEGHDFYWIEFFFSYQYTDTSGSRQWFRYSLDTTLTSETSIFFSGAQLFPNAGEIDSIEYSHGYFSLWAINGPSPEDDQGNVTGDAIGFFHGWTFGGYVDIFLDGSGSPASAIARPMSPMQRFREGKAKNFNL